MSLPADADLVDWTEYDWLAHVHDVNVANRRLRYVEMGQGPALLLIHGTGGSWTSWLLNLRELATEHRVIAPDVPGFGVSEGRGRARTRRRTPMRWSACSITSALTAQSLSVTRWAG